MKKKTLGFTAILTVILALCMTFCFAACAPKVTVTIDQETAEVLIGETVTLKATASDESSIVWTSDNLAVATVRNGKVTGVKAGTATIKATSGEAFATCTVTVKGVKVTFEKATETVEKGETVTLKATAEDNGTISWSSSDESIATVDDKGVVTGVAEGEVDITAARGTAGSATCKVTVVWTNKPEGYEVINFGEESKANLTMDKFVYWNDQNWCGTNVTVLDAYYDVNGAHFSYSGAADNCWFGFQIFLKHEGNVEGATYQLSFKLKSEQAGKITVKGTAVDIIAGDNDITVEYVEGGLETGSFSMQMGANIDDVGSVIPENTIAISGLTFTKIKDAAPKIVETVTVGADVKLEKKEDKAMYIINGGTFVLAEGADTTAEDVKANIEKEIADAIIFNLQGNPWMSAQSWDGDWANYCENKHVITVDLTAKTYTLEVDITSLKAYCYTTHCAPKSKQDDTDNWSNYCPEKDSFETEITIGTKTYKMSYVKGSESENDFWGCIGITVTEAAAE